MEGEKDSNPLVPIIVAFFVIAITVLPILPVRLAIVSLVSMFLISFIVYTNSR